ncbi:MAG: nucleoside 2-deoxyribosyltransferase [Thermoproteota archaeon]
MAKIYLAVPIIGGRDLESASKIGQLIENLGHQIISDWVLASDPGWNLPAEAVYSRDFGAIKRCDILMAEVSVPSHGVGMEIMFAHMLNKKIICLRRAGIQLSRLILGMPGVEIIEYSSLADLEEKLRTIL